MWRPRCTIVICAVDVKSAFTQQRALNNHGNAINTWRINCRKTSNENTLETEQRVIMWPSSQAALQVLTVCLSVCLSVCRVRAPYSRTEKYRNIKICVNVSRDRMNCNIDCKGQRWRSPDVKNPQKWRTPRVAWPTLLRTNTTSGNVKVDFRLKFNIRKCSMCIGRRTAA